jgi:hypothetical protein
MSHRRVAAVVLTSLLVAGCGDSTTEPGGETEVISRVTVTLTPPAGAAQTAFIDDADGNGPGAPSAQQGALALARNTTYTGTIRFENRLENPPEDITTEVAAEANEHRVFYSASGAGVTITATDTDAQGRPLGLRYTVATGATPAAGQITVVLCHYDNVAKPATATSCSAETDINVSFSYTIQP